MLMFDIKEEMEVASQVITTLMEQLDVFISIKPKPKQPSKVINTQLPLAHSETSCSLFWWMFDKFLSLFIVCYSEERRKECWEYV